MSKQSQQNAVFNWKQLLYLSQQLANQTSPEEQCRILQQITHEFLSAEVRVWLAYPAYPLWGAPKADVLPFAAATPLAHRAFEEKKTAYSAPRADGESPEILTCLDGVSSMAIAVPLIAREMFLGILQVDAAGGRFFREDEVTLIEGIAMHTSFAMEITRQEAMKTWYQEQLNLVQSVSAQVSSLPGLDDLYHQVTRLIQETFEYDYVAVFILEEGKNALTFRGSASRNGDAPLEPGFTLKPGEGIVGHVAQTGQEIVSPDVQQDPRYRHLEALSQTRSEAALPMKVESRILGILDVQSDQTDAFQERDMLVLRALANQVALAVESKNLTFGLERRAEQISTVFEVSHALTSILDLDLLLSEVVRLIQNRFGYPFIHIYTVHMGRRLVIYQTGIGERSETVEIHDQHFRLDDPKGIISWVARNGKAFLSNDVTQEPLYLPSNLPPHDTRSELTIPLILGTEVLGILDIQSREVNAFDEKDQSLFEALAASVAIAMRNATLYRSEQWRRKVAESFRDVAQLISSTLPLNQLLEIILEKLENNLPCDASAIWLLDEAPTPSAQDKGQRLRLAATRNINPESIFTALEDPAAQDILHQALETQQPFIRPVDQPLGPVGAALGFPPSYSSITASMWMNNQPLGLITLVQHQEGRYGSEAQAITATFAGYAAVAIQNSRLYNQTQEQALISTMLLQVAEACQTIMNIDDLLSTMIRMTRLLVGVKKCAFLTWEDSLQSFRLAAWYGFEPEGDGQRLFSPQTPGLATLLEERGTLYFDDPERDLDLPEFHLAQGTTVALPLLVRGKIVGAFLVGLQMAWATGTESGFDPKALAILQGIAQQTSITIDNLDLQEARQEEAYVTAALLQVAQAVVSSNDLNDTLDTIVHLLPILIGNNTCVIYLWDASNLLFRPTQAYAENRREEEQIIGRPFAPGEYTLLDAVRDSGEMHLCKIPDPGLSFLEWAPLPCQVYDPDTTLTSLPQGDWVLGYPLSLQGQVFGALVVRESSTSPAFWERRLEILYGIAQQTSLAIQNDLFKQELVQTERIEREIQLARQIQETFLPEELPQLNHWELDLRWETAREVGGDFYDIFNLSEGRVGLVIADVSDKGIPAALYMTVARTLIRANASGGQPPAEVLEEVNKLLLNDSSDAMFITAVYAILHLETGKLEYANAGHNRPLLYRKKKGDVEQLPKGGMALGVLDGLKLVNHNLTIYPGEALVLYTDGVTDLTSPEGKFFGEERLISLVKAHGNKPVREMLEYLDDALIEFRRGTPPLDDITLLAVRREALQRKRNGTKKLAPPENKQPDAA